jgi:hypothetical protein
MFQCGFLTLTAKQGVFEKNNISNRHDTGYVTYVSSSAILSQNLNLLPEHIRKNALGIFFELFSAFGFFVLVHKIQNTATKSDTPYRNKAKY